MDFDTVKKILIFGLIIVGAQVLLLDWFGLGIYGWFGIAVYVIVVFYILRRYKSAAGITGNI